ncbi:MAG: zincin-like metallopeptidase domain-containing protein [Verrucomicrobiae bacterium]|nr:zincin-like metallopeptidase domain-containing protein [Verrucomicrobiae bacterium]
MNEVYQIITDKMLELLKQGQIPWKMPWVNGVPQNLVTRKPYRGINVLLTMMKGYGSPYWLTFKQAQDLGGTIKKGSKSTLIVFWKFLPKLDETGKPVLEKDGKVKQVPMLRYYNAFNLMQTEGIEHPSIAPASPARDLAKAQEIVEQAKICPIQEGAKLAAFDLKNDIILMPPRAQFRSQELFYHTLFHEMTHATGHSSRLARPTLGAKRSTPEYAKEELIAEIGASFLSNQAGIMDKITFEHPAGYIQDWIVALENDPLMVVQAAGQAQKATDLIQGISWENNEQFTPDIESGPVAVPVKPSFQKPVALSTQGSKGFSL